MKNKQKQMKGFAVMTKKQRASIASLGGLAVASKKGHMAKIGAIGGRNSHGGHPRIVT